MDEDIIATLEPKCVPTGYAAVERDRLKQILGGTEQAAEWAAQAFALAQDGKAYQICHTLPGEAVFIAIRYGQVSCKRVPR